MAYLKLSDFSMYYEIQGHGDETWLWIHGNIASTRWWHHVRSFVPDHVRLIMMDLRGCGQSSRPDEGYKIEQYAEDVYALIKQLGLHTFHLLGHSMGGLVALTLTLNHPELVTSLTLLDSVPAGGLELDDARRKGFRELLGSSEALAQAVRLCLPYCTDEDYIQSVIRDAAACADSIYLENPETMHETDLSSRLGEISCPVLILHGREDVIIPAATMAETIDKIPQARVILLEQCGHSPFNERPEVAFQHYYQFLKEVPL